MTATRPTRPIVAAMGIRTLSAIGVLAAAVLASAAGARSHAPRLDRGATARIAFSCAGDICVIDSDRCGRRRLTRDKFIDSYPAWSPDGKTITFTANIGRTLIYAMDTDGGSRVRLTPRGASDALAAWSPDGRTIAFDNNRTGEIDLMNADGSGRRRLTRRTASLPAWSPDGTKIAFVSANGRRLALTTGDIYVINVHGGGQQLLTRNGTFPSWSPDGRKLAFLRNKRGWSSEVGLWTMNADGTGSRRIWSHSAEGGGLSWSPDGMRITLTSNNNVYVIHVDGSSPERVTQGSGDNLNPAWQPLPGRTSLAGGAVARASDSPTVVHRPSKGRSTCEHAVEGQ